MADFNVVGCRQVAVDAWNAAAAGSATAWVHHRREWIEAYSTWPGIEDMSFAVLDSDGGIVALVPAYRQARKVAGVIGMPLLSLHGGVAIMDSCTGRTRQRVSLAVDGVIGELAKRMGAVTIEALLPPLAPAFAQSGLTVAPLWELGWRDTSTATWMVALSSDIDALWQGLEGRARTAVRKAEKAGVDIERSNAPDDWRRYEALHQTTASRTGVTAKPSAFFERIWSTLKPAGLAQAYFARKDGRDVGAVIVLSWKGGAVYNSGAATAEGLDTEANSLLVWTALKEAATEGLARFDVGEAAPLTADGKARNLSEFKRSFGGSLSPLPRARRIAPGRWHVRLRGLQALVTGRST